MTNFENITSAQLAYIAKLKNLVGETRYQRIKNELNIPQDSAVPDLSKNQAAQLIRKLILVKNRRDQQDEYYHHCLR